MHPEGDPDDLGPPLLEDPELVRRAKAVMRKRARGLRSAIPRDAILERSRRIVERLLGLEALKNGQRVALFRAIEGRNEVDVSELDARLRARGVAIYYPSIEDEPEGDAPPTRH